jgi:hypothetical protein
MDSAFQKAIEPNYKIVGFSVTPSQRIPSNEVQGCDFRSHKLKRTTMTNTETIISAVNTMALAMAEGRLDDVLSAYETNPPWSRNRA